MWTAIWPGPWRLPHEYGHSAGAFAHALAMCVPSSRLGISTSHAGHATVTDGQAEERCLTRSPRRPTQPHRSSQ